MRKVQSKTFLYTHDDQHGAGHVDEEPVKEPAQFASEPRFWDNLSARDLAQPDDCEEIPQNTCETKGKEVVFILDSTLKKIEMPTQLLSANRVFRQFKTNGSSIYSIG